MTRKMTKPSFPYALASSTLGTVLVSMTAVWLVTSAYAPASRPDLASVHQSHSSSFSSHSHFQLSPIPPGADWTS
jgi:hypothetical protein